MSALQHVQDWYKARCNGVWEQSAGIRIESLDKPGWSLVIDLKGTPLEGKEYKPYQYRFSEIDWIDCRVEDNQFRGTGGPRKLEELLDIFITWKSKFKRPTKR